MNKVNKIVGTFMLAAAMAVSAIGCGGRSNVVTEDINEVEIYMVEAGYRSQFMDEWIKAFTAKNPEITFTTPTKNAFATDKAASDITNAKSTVDIWFTGNLNMGKYVQMGSSAVRGYDCVFEDLTGLYDTKIPGEEVTIREKAIDKTVMYNTIEGKQYSLSWASGPSALLMNKSFGIEMPKTSDQFLKLVQDIADGKEASVPSNVKPFLWTGGNASGYWDFLMDTWKAQYDGIDGYEAYHRIGFADGPSYEALHQEGILESYKALDQLAKEEYSVYGSETMMHTDGQQSFLRGNAVFMPNGDWFETEMKSTGIEGDFVMVKVPVISSLANKIRLAGGTDAAANEAKLIEIVTDIDNGMTLEELKLKYSTIAANKIDAVWEARHVVYNMGFGHLAYIPAYSNAKTASKKFLQFVCSDEGIAIFRKYAGSSMPYKYTPAADEERSDFQKSLDDIMKDAISFYPTKILSPLRYATTMISDSGTWVDFYKDEKTPEQAWDYFYNYGKDRWNSFLIQAGLK